MIPAGYMAKKLVAKPDQWVSLKHVSEIYSISGCISPAFPAEDHIEKLNAFWFTDSPDLIKQTPQENAIEQTNFQIFYYEIYEFEIQRHS